MNSVNISLFRLINDLGFQLKFMNPIIAFIAEYGVFLLAFWMILCWFSTHEKVHARVVLLGSLISFLISEVIGKVLGTFIEHPQPFAALPDVTQLISHEIDNSFPSDHTILFFSICMMFFLGSKSSKRVFYLIAASIVGIARIWAGVHYPIDILVAALIGILVASILYPIITRSKVLVRIINIYDHFAGLLKHSLYRK